jgi:transcriptional regulator with XRE-family HTH domain
MANLFAQNLKILRKQRALSRERLAFSLKGCSGKNIQTWEYGHQPGYDMLIQIADFFNVTVDHLLKEEIK